MSSAVFARNPLSAKRADFQVAPSLQGIVMPQKLGLEMQTVFGLPPIEHLQWAAELGLSFITLGPKPLPWRWEGFDDWSLADARIRRNINAATQELGVEVLLGEGFAIRPGVEATDHRDNLDHFAELGASFVNTVTLDPDYGRTMDQLGQLAELSHERGLTLTLEFAPPHLVSTLEEALALIRQLQNSRILITLDTMHFFRSGGTLEQLTIMPASLIGHIQLSDVPLLPTSDNYYQEACFARCAPGLGELPLKKCLSALPPERTIGLEIPTLPAQQTRESLYQSIKDIVDASVALFVET